MAQLGYNLPMTKVTREFGICQACLGEFHVHAKKMVLHGYKRPGTGYIEGDCVGVGEAPYELSCELQKKLVASSRAKIADLQKNIDKLSSPTFAGNLFVDGAYNPKIRGYDQVEVGPSDHRWNYKREALISNWRSLARQIQHNVDRWEAMIADWKIRPVRSFEEIQEQVKAQREAAAGARQRALADKQATMIANLQKRVDSTLKGMAADYQKAVKKGELDTLWLSSKYDSINRLENLYEMITSGLFKLRDDGKMDIGIAAEALGRPSVVRALGLADERDALRIERVERPKGGYRTCFPRWGGEWVDGTRDSFRVYKHSEAHLRAREGMMRFFAQK